MKDFLTGRRLCQALGICRKTLYNWCLDGVPLTYVFEGDFSICLYDLNDVRSWALTHGKKIK